MNCELCKDTGRVYYIEPMSQPPKRVSAPCDCLLGRYGMVLAALKGLVDIEDDNNPGYEVTDVGRAEAWKDARSAIKYAAPGD